jgi:hypothetical protein
VDGTYDHIQRYACQGNGTCNETDKGRVVATIYMANFSAGQKSQSINPAKASAMTGKIIIVSM